jgi:aminoglycoside phosphotransferase (APT) family kinase protein
MTGANDWSPGEAHLAAWVVSVVGRQVRDISRVGYGASRATFLVHADDLDMVARVDTGDGPMAGTELSLSREAEVYRALGPTGVRIPRYFGLAPDGMTLLSERAAGTHILDGLDDHERAVVLDDYIDALAELHSIDPSGLDLPSYRRPTDATSHATEELDLWEGILRTRTTSAWPLAHFAFAVLRRHAPRRVARTVLCHGDFGPGNFLHDGGRVTAMVDWEFSHIGDPMDDLGWWVFRGHDMAGRCGDLGAQLARWSSRTGLPVEPTSVEYYRAFVMLRWLVSVATTLDSGGSGLDRSVHFALVPVLGVRLPRALATILGVDLGDPPAIPQPSPGPSAAVIEALSTDLRDVVAPHVTDPEALRRATGAQVYCAHLAAVDALGPALAVAEAEDLEETWGGDGDPAKVLAERVRSGDTSAELLRYLWRHGVRQAALWPSVAARIDRPATPIPPPKHANPA